MSKRRDNIFVKLFKLILIIILLPFVIIYLIKRHFKRKAIKTENEKMIRVSDVNQLDNLSGIEFEDFLKKLYEKNGYQVESTPVTKDYGADLILTRKSKKIIIQAKCYTHTVGVSAVQEVNAAKSYYKADEAWVVTNNYFSREAENLALTCNVRLFDRVGLQEEISKHDIRIERIATTWSAMSPESKQEIMRKYKYWI